MAQRAGTGGRPGDFTGQQKAKLAKEHAEEVTKREGEISLMNAAALHEQETTIVDHTGDTPMLIDADDVEVLDEVQVAEAPTRIVRVLADCEPTIGAGQHYEFKEGQKVRVPAHVAAHLEEKGLVAV